MQILSQTKHRIFLPQTYLGELKGANCEASFWGDLRQSQVRKIAYKILQSIPGDHRNKVFGNIGDYISSEDINLSLSLALIKFYLSKLTWLQLIGFALLITIV